MQSTKTPPKKRFISFNVKISLAFLFVAFYLLVAFWGNISSILQQYYLFSLILAIFCIGSSALYFMGLYRLNPMEKKLHQLFFSAPSSDAQDNIFLGVLPSDEAALLRKKKKLSYHAQKRLLQRINHRIEHYSLPLKYFLHASFMVTCVACLWYFMQVGLNSSDFNLQDIVKIIFLGALASFTIYFFIWRFGQVTRYIKTLFKHYMDIAEKSENLDNPAGHLMAENQRLYKKIVDISENLHNIKNSFFAASNSNTDIEKVNKLTKDTLNKELSVVKNILHQNKKEVDKHNIAYKKDLDTTLNQQKSALKNMHHLLQEATKALSEQNTPPLETSLKKIEKNISNNVEKQLKTLLSAVKSAANKDTSSQQIKEKIDHLEGLIKTLNEKITQDSKALRNLSENKAYLSAIKIAEPLEGKKTQLSQLLKDNRSFFYQ